MDKQVFLSHILSVDTIKDMFFFLFFFFFSLFIIKDVVSHLDHARGFALYRLRSLVPAGLRWSTPGEARYRSTMGYRWIQVMLGATGNIEPVSPCLHILALNTSDIVNASHRSLYFILFLTYHAMSE